jgi:predicted phosphodiesterase
MSHPRKTKDDLLRDADEIIRKKNAEVIGLRRELNRRVVEKESSEKIRTQIFNLAEVTPDPPDWIDREPGKGASGIPLINASDWHWGERVSYDQTGGANRFNRVIATRRVRVLYDTITDLCFNHMTNPNYPGCVLCLSGDMITGAIHDDLRETNDGPVTWSVIEVENNIIGLIIALAKKFGRVFVPCVPGNHGRNTIKPRAKNRVFDSYEWLIYVHIEQYFKKHPEYHVDVHVPNGVDAHFNIFGHRFMQTHGDTLGVKGGDGIIGALGPIARGAVKVGTQQRAAGKDFDTLIIGHYHIYIPRGDATPVMCNGSLIGPNEYSQLILRVPGSRPSQSLAFVHHKHGFTAQWPMYVDEKKMADARTKWVDWTPARPWWESE